jgi:hypothetical protein
VKRFVGLPPHVQGFNYLLSAYRNEYADDDDANFANKLTPTVGRLR